MCGRCWGEPPTLALLPPPPKTPRSPPTINVVPATACCNVSSSDRGQQGKRWEEDLELDGKQVQLSIFLKKFADSRNVLVGIADDVEDGQQLAQTHGEVLRHPATPCQQPPLLVGLLLCNPSPFLSYSNIHTDASCCLEVQESAGQGERGRMMGTRLLTGNTHGGHMKFTQELKQRSGGLHASCNTISCIALTSLRLSSAGYLCRKRGMQVLGRDASADVESGMCSWWNDRWEHAGMKQERVT